MQILNFIKKIWLKEKVVFLLAAYKRYPDYFKISDTVISKLHIWIDRPDHDQPKTCLDCCKHGSIVRAYNLYKSVNLLLKHDHWEDAAILSRAMFELLLNLEEIVKDESQAELLARKYLRFQKLQEFLHSIKIINYEISTGRRPKNDSNRVKEIQETATRIFDEFRDKGSPTGWTVSWCNKSVHNLAKNARNRMHLHNYKILYSLFSDISHSGPFAIATSFTLGDNLEETAHLFEGVEEKDRKYLLLTLSMATCWLLEIVTLGSSVLKLFEIDFTIRITKKMHKLYEKNS